MEESGNIEAQSLIGQANSYWRISNSNRKRQRMAIILLFTVVVLVILAIFIWIINFSPSQTTLCDKLQSEYCKTNKQQTFFREDLFKLVYQKPQTNNFVFRSNTPLSIDYQIMEDELLSAMYKITGIDFNTIKFTLYFYTLADTSFENIEICNVAGLDCYQRYLFKNPKNFQSYNILKELVGDKISPYESEDENYSKCKVETLKWQEDFLPSKIEEIDNILNDNGNNIVILNGNKGIDRVGELSAAFKLYKGFNFNETLVENICDLNQTSKKYLNSIMWYCCHLNFSNNKDCLNIYEMDQFANIKFE